MYLQLASTFEVIAVGRLRLPITTREYSCNRAISAERLVSFTARVVH